MSHAKSAEKVVQDIRRKTRRRFSAEEKIRIVLEGMRGEESIAALCRRESLNSNLSYRWSKEFLEAGKKPLGGDTPHEAGRLSHTLDHGTPFGGWQGCEVPEVLPSSVCEFVRIFPSQAISPDLS